MSMDALAAAAGDSISNASNAPDLSMLMGGTGESAGSAAVAASLAGYTSAFASLDQAWKNDPRALWSSFAMIIVRPLTPSAQMRRFAY